MATIRLYIDLKSAKKDGSFPIRLKLGHNSQNTTIKTPYSVPVKFWDGVQILKRAPGIDNTARTNMDLQRRLLRANDLINSLTGSNVIQRLNISQLKKLIEKAMDAESGVVSPGDFLSYARSFIARKFSQNERTGQFYQTTINKIVNYCNSDFLSFSDINKNWLIEFNNYLSSLNNSVNTRNIDFRNIRAIFNAAIDDDVIGLELYPFRKFKIKNTKTPKRSLNFEQLKVLRDYPVLPKHELYRDLFMLSFYLIGISAKDMLNLRHIIDGRVEYCRFKTAQLISVKLEPEAMEIITRYRGRNFLLNVMDRYKNHKDFLKYWNAALKEIGKNTDDKEQKSAFPGLSTYWTRHTWATLAGELETPIETISMALGHEVGSKTTWVYYKFNQKKIDEANRNVLDELKKPAPEGAG